MGVIENIFSSVSEELLRIISEQMNKSLCKIRCNHITKGSGFLCLIPFPNKLNLLSVLATNNHVLDENDLTIDKKIKIFFQNNNIYNIYIDKERKTYTSNKYGVSFVEIKHNELDINLFLEIDEPNRINNIKDIYLVYHNRDWREDYSMDQIRTVEFDKFTIVHKCANDARPSGGPIINKLNQKVINKIRG